MGGQHGRVPCATHGCRAWVKSGLVCMGRGALGQTLSDGTFCSACRVQHAMDEQRDYPFKCPNCKRKTDDVSEMVEHIQDSHFLSPNLGAILSALKDGRYDGITVRRR